MDKLIAAPSEGELEFWKIVALGAGIEIPKGFLECWHWIKAIHAHDFGDSGPLSALVASEADMPANVRAVLADIVTGNRVPSEKAVAQLKIKGTDRMVAARSALFYSQYRKRLKNKAQHLADREGMEPVDVIENVNRAHRTWQKQVYEQYGIGRDTLDDLRRELEGLIKGWPTL